jgi:glycosyltransferase involved in cell wall biosynthesis
MIKSRSLVTVSDANHTPLITQVLPNLTGGGAERVAVNLGNYWSSLGYDVEIALMHPSGDFLREVLPGVRIVDLKARRVRQVPWALRKHLLERRPDITVAHMWPLTSASWLAWFLAGKLGKFFACEHIGLTNHIQRDLNINLKLARSIVNVSHSRATGVIGVSEGVSQDLVKFGRISTDLVSTIYNPVADTKVLGTACAATAAVSLVGSRSRFRTSIVSVGTLKPQKNYPLLLRAFSLVAEELDASLIILGEGSERARLERLVNDLGLQDRVDLLGFQPNPHHWLESADLFVLASDYEGFANVIVEALACGTPVVSTDCPYGPAEILGNGQFGVLVRIGNVEQLACGIRQALSREWDSHELKTRAFDFAIPKQSELYLKLFGL